MSGFRAKLAIPFAAGALLASAAPVYGADVLTAAKVAAAPKVSAFASDPAWAQAPELEFPIFGGANFNAGNSNVDMKAVYTADMICFLIQYDDPTQSVRRSPYVKQADGSWKKLSDPDDKGGTYYLKAEDKAAFDDSKFAPGDEVASIMVEKFTGERGVNDAALEYRNGKYTYVIARKPVTGGKYDIRFKDLAAEHPFGFAAFDNAQVRHAVNGGVLKLKFAR